MSTKSFNSPNHIIDEYESITPTASFASDDNSIPRSDRQDFAIVQEEFNNPGSRSSDFFLDQPEHPVSPATQTTVGSGKEQYETQHSLYHQRSGTRARTTTAKRNSTPDTEVLDEGKLTTKWLLKQGHSLTYFGVFIFTLFLYFRPYELFPALAALSSVAYWSALVTLLIYVPTQLGLEGSLTARPREVNLLLLFTLTVLLSMPLAADRGVAWEAFSGTYIKVILMFIVMVNVIRTERRLKILIWLSLAVSCYLSYRAILDYQALKFSTYGDRISGAIGNLFGNPNDMAIHFVMTIPIAVALLFGARNSLGKLVYAACAILTTVGLVLTYSRGGFLALVGGAALFAWKVGKRNRVLVFIGGAVILVAFVALAPGEFAGRLASIFDKSLDTGSVDARSALFWRSLHVAIANPIFGVGFENFPIVGIKNQVSHNAYTQVAAELGFTALVIYCLFLITPFKRLLHIERSVEPTKNTRTLYYLAIGLQSSLVAYAIGSFFGSVAYQWYLYYLVAYILCLDRLYATHTLNIAAQNAPVKDRGERRNVTSATQAHAHQFEDE